MTETSISYVRAQGWTRLGLPAALLMLCISVMLWAAGLFDAAADPLLHALIFALSAVIAAAATPLSVGWALQGFVVRRKHVEDGDDHHAGGHTGGHAAATAHPASSAAAAHRPRGG
jgi:hypothetical protein